MFGRRFKKKKAVVPLLIVSVFSLMFSGMQAYAFDTSATVSTSYTYFMDQTDDVNDGILSYDETPHNRWTAYESPNASDWVQTDFGSAVTRSSADIYLYDDGGGVKVPSSYNVQYWNGTAWVDAASQSKSPAAPAGNQLNKVTFASVSASKFRIVFTHQTGSKSGVTEISYGTDTSSGPPPTNPPSTELQGTTTASYTFSSDNAAQANDGIISYNDSPRNRWTSYQSPNATDWLQTELSAASSVTQAEIYLFDDGGGVKAPASYNVQYWNGSAWVDTANQSKSPSAPTGNQVNTVTFTPVTTSKLRVVFTPKSGSSSGVTEINYYGTASGGTGTPGNYPQYQLSVVSPSYGASVNGDITIKFYAPGMKNVWARAWHQPDTANPNANGYDSWFARVTPDQNGYGEVTFHANQFPHGPTTVILSSWDSAEGDSNFSHSDNCYLQLYNEGGVTWKQGIPSAPAQATGMSVLFQDDFTGPLSATRTGAGATYATAKPDAPNGTEFGDAIFADNSGANNPFAILGNQYLRIRASKAPAGTVDPMGWNRTYTGGLLSSVRTDGTGIAATYGYFEARILMPAGKGTWPAFWLMSQNSISQSVPSTAELDTVEAYGQDPSGACQSKHWWSGNPEMHETHCSSSNFTFGDNASTWHTYGTKITPADTIYYIDNVEVWRHATFEQAKTPMYFMINLALGGGWPIDLERYNNQVDMFVDYVRVFQ